MNNKYKIYLLELKKELLQEKYNRLADKELERKKSIKVRKLVRKLN